MRILLVEPNTEPKAAEIDSSLESMQKVVGGLIQAVYPFVESVALTCNDEGKLLGLPLNRPLCDPHSGIVYDIIAGTFFLCSAPPDSDHFENLTEEQIKHYSIYFGKGC